MTALSGPTSISFADCSNAGIVLRLLADPAPLTLRTGDIVLAKPAEGAPRAPIAWTVTWETPTASDPSIHEYQSVGSLRNGCPLAGRYKLPVTVFQKQENGDIAKTALEIEVVRTVDPTLDAASPVSLVLETWPFDGAFRPLPGLSLSELSGAADLGQVFAIGSALKDGAGDLTPIRLTAPVPVTLAAGRSAVLGLALSQTPAPGSYTARLSLHGLALKQSQPIEVTLKVRIIWYFLLIALALGVGAGWLVNIYLAGRAALGAARLQGLGDAAAIAARAVLQKDSAVQQRLLVLAAAVESKLGKAGTPAEIQAAVKDGQDMAAKIESRAAETAKDLLDTMVRLRGWVAPQNAVLDDALADRLLPLIRALDSIERDGAAGDAEAALAKAHALEPRIKAEAPRFLRDWLEALNAALERLGPWADPAQEPELTRSKLQAAVAEAFAQADPAVLLQQTNAVARSLASWVSLGAPGAIVRAFRRAAEILGTGGRTALADIVLEAAAEVQGLGTDRRDPIAKIESLADIRGALEEELRASRPNDAAFDKRLADGDFAGAAEILAPPPKAPPPAPAALQMFAAGPLARPKAPLPMAAAATILPRLVLPPHLEQGQRIRVTLDWSLASLPRSGPRWESDPGDLAEIAGGSAEGAELTARKAGFLSVIAAFAGHSPIIARTYVGEAVDTAGYRATAAGTQRVNALIAGVTAVLTVFFGYEIFIAGWYGTFADFFAAFLWGFFGQFGLERLRDLAKPVTGKALP